MLQKKFYFFGYLSICFMIAFSLFAAAQKETENWNKNPKASISVDQKKLSLVFQLRDITSQLQEMILSDLERILCYGDSIKWHEYSGKKQIGGQRITYKLGNEWKKQWFPDILRRELWAGLTINDKIHLVIPEKLIDVYREKLTIKRENPGIVKKLRTFIGLLNSKEELRTLAEGNPQESKISLFFFNRSPAEITKEQYKEGFMPLVDEAINFETPLLLELKPFDKWKDSRLEPRENISNSSLDKAVIALTPIIMVSENDDRQFSYKYPLIFLKDEWHFLIRTWKMP